MKYRVEIFTSPRSEPFLETVGTEEEAIHLVKYIQEHGYWRNTEWETRAFFPYHSIRWFHVKPDKDTKGKKDG